MLEMRQVGFSVSDDNDGSTKEIIKNVSLKIEDREFVAITGRNGGGKSTLARLIMGIEKPTTGTILYNGEDITNLSIYERAKKGIGFAFQQPVRFKGLQVFDLIRLATGSKLSSVDACKYLSEVGLCAREYINREVNASLSGGELQRIEIATVLAKGSQLSVFDEPEAGIDLWSFQNLIKVFESMRKKIKDSSILIISHQERILNIADEVVVISDGNLISHGPKDEILPTLEGTMSAVKRCGKGLAEEGGEE